MLETLLLISAFLWYGAGLIEGRTCKLSFGGCDIRNGLCWDTEEGTSFCTCKSGYNFEIPATRSGKCVNINECRAGLHSCDTELGRCVDTIGSHRCVCNEGYVLDYSGTKCLRMLDVKGTCRPSRRHGCSQTLLYDFMRLIGHTRTSRRTRRQRCECERGYELKNSCKYCQDVNECKRGLSKCDSERGSCHNTQGGYYCTCRTGYVLGPCGFKCYKPTRRPQVCTSSVFKASSHIRGDSDGLNDEVSTAVLLDHDTEKAARIAKILGRCATCGNFQTLMHARCHGTRVRTQTFDIDRDERTDITIKYLCLKNRYEVKSVFDKEAFWTPWTCWTECKITCSGGIQTRTRICKHGLVGEGRCKGPATLHKSCYKGKKCKLRIRRDAHTLNEIQKKDLIQAMEKYKKDTSTFGFSSAAGTHVFPLQCLGTNGRSTGCCYHASKLNFVMWHRAELLNFEEGLSRHLKDKTLGLPYWNWLQHPNPPSLAWDKTLYGKPNPFASMTCRFDTNPPIQTHRSANVDARTVSYAKSTYYGTVRGLMRSHVIHEFSEALENAHNMIHGSICTDGPVCRYSMAGLEYAAFDPIFFFHHTNVDRLFSVFQQYMQNRGETAWTRQSALEPQENILRFSEPYQPFRNTTLTPFKRLHKLSNMADLFYYRHMLGYEYDSLRVPNQPREGSHGDSEKEHVPASSDQLLIAQYERSIGTNVKVSYYFANSVQGMSSLGPCSILSESNGRFLGNVHILGSKHERAWNSTTATIINVHNRLFSGETGWRIQSSGISAASNIKITACYTHHVACRKKCKQVSEKVKKLIPAPQLLFYPKYIKIDVFKFEWDALKRLPGWQLNINSGSQWLIFWGKEVEHIVEVDSRDKYDTCNSVGAKKDNYKRPFILCTGVHYFIHKKRADCNKGMKLNLLASI